MNKYEGITFLTEDIGYVSHRFVCVCGYRSAGQTTLESIRAAAEEHLRPTTRMAQDYNHHVNNMGALAHADFGTWSNPPGIQTEE